MRTIRLKLAELLEGQPPSPHAPDVVSITPLVLKQFGFLPQPIVITIEGDEVDMDKVTTTVEALFTLDETRCARWLARSFRAAI